MYKETGTGALWEQLKLKEAGLGCPGMDMVAGEAGCGSLKCQVRSPDCIVRKVGGSLYAACTASPRQPSADPKCGGDAPGHLPSRASFCDSTDSCRVGSRAARFPPKPASWAKAILKESGQSFTENDPKKVNIAVIFVEINQEHMRPTFNKLRGIKRK